MLDCLAVGIGGFCGAICRYLAGLLPLNRNNCFPVNTLLINVIGSFLLSLIASVSVKNATVSPRIILFLKVGLCGGFTTFSTFAYESAYLLTGTHSGIGIVYIILSAGLGILAIILGHSIVG